MKEEELLKNERLKKVLSPHPLSFMRYQALSIFLIIWGVLILWFIHFSEWNSTLQGNFLLSQAWLGIDSNILSCPQR